MAKNDLEHRVAVLEQQVRQLISGQRIQPGPREWLSTVGMFSGDELMKQIDEAALKFREDDRKQARRKFAKKRRRAKS